ncbi:MAG: hypothetical protein E6H03_10550 [Bacillati bacterium ANGP1]|uniref:Uncharacterized protein n=1 Tax=Candidatus Segetimicrobium genomatis TaxID=2569760 RepID=A0A537J707_9BACT|nr:MAG: hypothetical protein E6H03_10550 [Terrabacteria group bacterium ANGP1]
MLVGDERNGTTTCPWSYYRIIDIRDEMRPVIISEMKLPEDKPQACRRGGPGDPKYKREFSAHNATPFKDVAFMTWYSGGLRAWEYADPHRPREVASSSRSRCPRWASPGATATTSGRGATPSCGTG